MAPLPSNSTAVLFVDYETSGEEHTLQIRFTGAATAVTAMDKADAFLTALTGNFMLITILGARQRAAASNVTLPITWTGAATYGSVVGTHSQSAWYVDFIGRSVGGRRVRLSLFGCEEMQDLASFDYRLPATGPWLAALDALRVSDETAVAIDGEEAIWYDYVNIGVNAYWRNRIR